MIAGLVLTFGPRRPAGPTWSLPLLLISVLAHGCVGQALVSRDIADIHRSNAAIRTLHDFEVAKSVSQSMLGELERLHYLDNTDADALRMLVRYWSQQSLVFIRDDYEKALSVDDTVTARYHLERAIAGLERALYYGRELLAQTDGDFSSVQQDPVATRAWLERNFQKQRAAASLLWLGYAWLGLAWTAENLPDEVARAPEALRADIGAELLKRSVTLHGTLEYGLGQALLGVYYARKDPPDLSKSRVHFARARKAGGGRYLMTDWYEAVSLDCKESDQRAFERRLNAILLSDDPLPRARLDTVAAKRLAQRSLASSRLYHACNFASARAD